MPRRPCLDCGRITARSRCPDHERARERARGTTTQRGYGARYQRERVAVLDGAEQCARCGESFTEANPATGGHVVALRDGGGTDGNVAAECADCNFGWRRRRSSPP